MRAIRFRALFLSCAAAAVAILGVGCASTKMGSWAHAPSLPKVDMLSWWKRDKDKNPDLPPPPTFASTQPELGRETTPGYPDTGAPAYDRLALDGEGATSYGRAASGGNDGYRGDYADAPASREGGPGYASASRAPAEYGDRVASRYDPDAYGGSAAESYAPRDTRGGYDRYTTPAGYGNSGDSAYYGEDRDEGGYQPAGGASYRGVSPAVGREGNDDTPSGGYGGYGGYDDGRSLYRGVNYEEPASAATANEVASRDASAADSYYSMRERSLGAAYDAPAAAGCSGGSCPLPGGTSQYLPGSTTVWQR